MTEKIKLGFYPYTYVRVAVMRSRLLKKEDYHKFLKMSANGIMSQLQSSTYRNEIDKHSSEFSGFELLEVALNANLASSFNKLKDVASFNKLSKSHALRNIIELYSGRKDIENLKSVLRAKYTNTDANDLKKLIQPAGKYSFKYFLKLLELESIKEILRQNKIIPYNYLRHAYQSFEKEKSLIDIETALDNFYYKKALNFAKDLPQDSTMFGDFLTSEVEVINILTLLKLHREKMSKADIKKYLIFIGAGLQDRKIRAMANANNLDEMFSMLKKTNYWNSIKEGVDELKQNNSLVELEIDLYHYLLEKFTFKVYKNPLSVDAILSYMFAKEIEIRNLKIITKAKQLNLSEEFTQKQLVMI